MYLILSRRINYCVVKYVDMLLLWKYVLIFSSYSEAIASELESHTWTCYLDHYVVVQKKYVIKIDEVFTLKILENQLNHLLMLKGYMNIYDYI